MPHIPTFNDNPFTMVYDALWDLVQRNPNLIDYLRTKEKFDTRDGTLRNITTSDLPEIVLVQDERVGSLRISSSQMEVTPTYKFVLTTGDQRINRILNQITWELLRSLVDWESVLCALQWPESDPKNFIINMRLGEVRDFTPGMIASEERESIRGWATIWSVTVQMRFAIESLRI